MTNTSPFVVRRPQARGRATAGRGGWVVALLTSALTACEAPPPGTPDDSGTPDGGRSSTAVLAQGGDWDHLVDTEPRIYPHEDIAPDIQAPFGDPMPWAVEQWGDVFYRGKEVFTRQYTVEMGLGPDFVTTSCVSCHERPVPGGSSSLYRNVPIAGTVSGEAYRILDDASVPVGTLNAGIVRLYRMGADGRARGALPDAPVDAFSSMNAIPLFGIGLLTLVPDEEILRLADPDDADGDGISGRAFQNEAGIGRIGSKAETAGMQEMATAAFQEMNQISMRPLNAEERAALPFPEVEDPHHTDYDSDGVADPELPDGDVFDLVVWEQLLAAPEFDLMTATEVEGRDRFDEIGCTTCHVPRLESSLGPIPAYTDLLLHDMGPDGGDGIAIPSRCGPYELRTQPLWGVAAAAPYMVDGRALTLHDAILEHHGEAQGVRDVYASLSAEEQDGIVAFLRTLGGREYGVQNFIAPRERAPDEGELGGRRPGLPITYRQFDDGRRAFDKLFSANEGLGSPFFNGDSCSACHNRPVVGGSGGLDVNVIRQGRFGPGIAFAPSPFGNMVGKVRIGDQTPYGPDPDAQIVEARQTTHVFGIALLDTISEATIAQGADPDDLNLDGVSGRVSRLPSGRVGRLGWKGQFENSLDITCTAFGGEMGLTTSSTVCEDFGLRSDDDPVADPEVPDDTVQAILDFMRALAPPPRGSGTAASQRGETVFTQIGCAECHTPVMQGSAGPVPCYSDLLLHDIAVRARRGIEEGVATMSEYRTAPLWGLSDSGPYMHTGEATTFDAAIALHAGEADRSRQAYNALTRDQRADLWAFLSTL